MEYGELFIRLLLGTSSFISDQRGLNQWHRLMTRSSRYIFREIFTNRMNSITADSRQTTWKGTYCAYEYFTLRLQLADKI